LARRAGHGGSMSPLREIYDRGLRNAVFHADYALHGGRINLIADERTVEAEEFNRLLNRALAYHHAIEQLHRANVSSYTESVVIPVHPGFAVDEEAVVIVREGHGVVGLKHSLTPDEIAAGGIQWRIGIFTRDELTALDRNPQLSVLPARA